MQSNFKYKKKGPNKRYNNIYLTKTIMSKIRTTSQQITTERNFKENLLLHEDLRSLLKENCLKIHLILLIHTYTNEQG